MNKKIAIAIGNRIQLSRNTLNMNSDTLADLIGVSQAQISRYETGERKISAEQLWHIAFIFRTQIEWFYQDCSLSLIDLAPQKSINEEDDLFVVDFSAKRKK